MPQNPSRAGTPRSITPSPNRRSEWISALKALIIGAALIWVGDTVFGLVKEVRGGSLALHIQPAWLVTSGAMILGTYLLLIWSWLYIVTGLSGQSIPFLVGARIWFISSLGTLLPGRVWGIVQMGVMTAEQGINPIAAGGASVINTAVNIACGMAVSAVWGSSIVASYIGRGEWAAWLVSVAAIVCVCLLPVLLPFAFRFARSRFGASVPKEDPPARIIILSAVANVAAYVLYGAAFLCLARGILDGVGGSVWDHTGLFAASYVVGYMFFISPAGLGAREQALIYLLGAAHLATGPQAAALTVASRLWLLIIQVLPALIFLAYRRPRNEKDSTAG